MATRRHLIGAALALGGAAAASRALGLQAPAPAARFGDRLTGDLAVHDPCIIKQGGTYHLFGTDIARGAGHIQHKTSPDLMAWKDEGGLIEALPGWASEAVPGTRGVWAPDVSFVNGRYRLYVSYSTFGSNRSAIGLFTNATLDRSAPDYAWRDEGLVLASQPQDRFNAIDPNFIVDRQGRHWLAFGSFWSGLKLRRLDPASGKPSAADPKLYDLCSRPAPRGAPGAVEAPFLIERGGWYYLFASYDYCCKGVQSSYYMVVGRSREITGPYLGRDGSRMLDGMGTVVIQGDRRWRGPGHNAVLRDEAGDFLVYHAYDATKDGARTLRISPIEWTADGWPEARL